MSNLIQAVNATLHKRLSVEVFRVGQANASFSPFQLLYCRIPSCPWVFRETQSGPLPVTHIPSYPLEMLRIQLLGERSLDGGCSISYMALYPCWGLQMYQSRRRTFGDTHARQRRKPLNEDRTKNALFARTRKKPRAGSQAGKDRVYRPRIHKYIIPEASLGAEVFGIFHSID